MTSPAEPDKTFPSAVVYGPKSTFTIDPSEKWWKPSGPGDSVFIVRRTDSDFTETVESDWHISFLAAMSHVAMLVTWEMRPTPQAPEGVLPE